MPDLLLNARHHPVQIMQHPVSRKAQDAITQASELGIPASISLEACGMVAAIHLLTSLSEGAQK
jgi:hypothetical protein